MEDFAQVFGLYASRKYGRASYEDIARVLWAVDEDRFRRFARRASLPDRLIAAVARETAQRLREAWVAHPATDLLSTPVRDAVSAHMARVPLGR